MCTRTKTSYGCGHSHKKTLSCKEKHCAGLERYHFEHDGDCSECRELTRRYHQHKNSGVNPVLDRGKAGLGRYGRQVNRDTIDEDDVEGDAYSTQRRGRSTSRRIATGALEREALRELQQPGTGSSGYRQQSSSKSYKPVKSQPLNHKQASYTTSYQTSGTPVKKATPPASKQDYNTHSYRAPSQTSYQRTTPSSSKYDTGFGNSYPSRASNQPSLQSENTTTTRYHVYYPPNSDSNRPIVVNIEERVPSSSSSSSKSFSSQNSTTRKTTSSRPPPTTWRHVDPRSYHSTSFPSSAAKAMPRHQKPEEEEISGVRIREVFPDNRTSGWVYGEVEEADDDDIVVINKDILGRGGMQARGTW